MIGESAEGAAEPPPPPPPPLQQEKPWHSYISEDLPRTVQESTDSALRSARSLKQNSSTHLQTVQDLVPQLTSQYKYYEDVFFKKVKDELLVAREHPTLVGGIALTAGLVFMRGPRRFLFRQTLGRFQSEEERLVKAMNNVNELHLSVDVMKKESQKLLERAGFAEKEMKDGRSQLMAAGREFQGLAKSIYKVEGQANDLMEFLREIPGREALKLRAEVASMASVLKDKRIAIDKKTTRISNLGLPL